MDKITEAKDKYDSIQRAAHVSTTMLQSLHTLIQDMREDHLDSQAIVMDVADELDLHFKSLRGDVLSMQTSVAKSTSASCLPPAFASHR